MSRQRLDLLAVTGVIVVLRRRPRRRFTALAGMAAVALLGVSAALHPVPRLVWNASPSAPVGLYWVEPYSALRRGDLVLATPPEAARRLAAERGYLPAGVPLVKRVVAFSGDTVCAAGIEITINGPAVAKRLPADRRGRPLPDWNGCRTLAANEFFLLMVDVPDSFDSRYFGPVSSSQIVGRLVPLWTR